jgi:hypothetical protein
MAPNLTLANETQVTFNETNLCAQVDELRNEYVFYVGGIAGISDSSSLKSDSERLDGGPDVIKLDRD